MIFFLVWNQINLEESKINIERKKKEPNYFPCLTLTLTIHNLQTTILIEWLLRI